MKLNVLDTKEENSSQCYLCRVDLSEYVDSIPNDYLEWNIQRGIVTNRYLDNLATTISNKMHIPPIVLVSENINIIKRDDNNKILEIELEDFKVLDGLQRTHRLDIINKSIKFLHEESGLKDEIESNPSRFTRRNSKNIKEISSNSKLIKLLISLRALELNIPKDFFEGNSIWLEIWQGLDDDQKIRKMLMLNAGHKSVNIKHQLELLFSGTKLNLEKVTDKNIKIVKEKDISAIQYSKKRELGVYHFSHVVSALISLSAGKVVNTNSDFVIQLQSGDLKEVDLIDNIDVNLLRSFITFLYELDKNLNDQFGDLGIKWLGREVVLVGLFGAIGAHCFEAKNNLSDFLTSLISNIPETCSKLDLESFEKVRNSVEINKVNLGNINKKAVYKAFYDLICKSDFQGWDVYFGGKENEL